ncbi:hypothetical protein NVP1170O_030 [Vibrio phage 1.170.O._10N.261.52.C3]|nr:hypothetical protein NVP1170O_030 [Vibrio phage 1.170.O._10N.261.52.C3]
MSGVIVLIIGGVNIVKSNELWVIRHKGTKEHWKAKSGKTAWKGKGHAKNAWSHTYAYEYLVPKELIPYYTCPTGYGSLKFDEQDLYEVVNISQEVILSKDEISKLQEDSRILKEIRENLLGQGFEVAGFHLNGDLESLDNWFESNGWVCDE